MKPEEVTVINRKSIVILEGPDLYYKVDNVAEWWNDDRSTVIYFDVLPNRNILKDFNDCYRLRYA